VQGGSAPLDGDDLVARMHSKGKSPWERCAFTRVMGRRARSRPVVACPCVCAFPAIHLVCLVALSGLLKSPPLLPPFFSLPRKAPTHSSNAPCPDRPCCSSPNVYVRTTLTNNQRGAVVVTLFFLCPFYPLSQASTCVTWVQLPA
jgi:hypothetical protein